MNRLPISHAIEQIAGGLEDYTHEEVEQAIWAIDKPIQKITLADISAEIDRMRQLPDSKDLCQTCPDYQNCGENRRPCDSPVHPRYLPTDMPK